MGNIAGLRLGNVGAVIKVSHIQHNEVPQLVEPELAFDSYDFHSNNPVKMFAKMAKIGINISLGRTFGLSVLNDLTKKIIQ